MTYREIVDRLCRHCGIEPAYFDIWGRRQEAGFDSRRSLLAAMGLPVGDEAALREALDARAQRVKARPLEPVYVVRESDAPPCVSLSFMPAQARGTSRWRLTAESGDVSEGEFCARDLAPIGEAGEDGLQRASLPLARSPGCGYHRLEADLADGCRAQGALIIAPRRCHTPTALQHGGRVWGPGVQLYALRSKRNWGIGDFTDLGTLAADLAGTGAGIVGVNPLHALFPHNPEHASPYSPSSRLFLNVLYIDVEAVPEFAECEPARALAAGAAFRDRLLAARAADLVQYSEVAALKMAVLERLYAHFREHHLAPGSTRARSFSTFVRAGGQALARHTLFEALQEHFHRADPAAPGWRAWPAEYRSPETPAVARFAAAHGERIAFYQYLQWVADEQLAGTAVRTEGLGLDPGLYRDLAVGVDPDGAEAWSSQGLYALDASIGAPPDDYSLSGQDWGLPPPIPEALYENAYAPFIATLRANMRHASALRIDHVMALMRLFWVPPGGRPADGAYVRYPFADLLGILALESQRNRCLIVGEDLGTVPAEVPEALGPLGVLSYRLFYFERDAGGELTAPEHYPEQALVAVSTHDLPTLAGFWQGQELHERAALGLFPSEEDRDRQLLARMQDRARLLIALERQGLLPEGTTVDPASCPEMSPALVDAVYRYLARTPARIMIVQLEDVTGQLLQVNLPGTTQERPNWRYRLAAPIEEILGSERLRVLAAAVGRERPAPRRTRPGPAEPVCIPRATYRLQFNREFTFRHAAAVVPYLARLGISHCYASPYLKARAGSTHGYDIVDHSALNPEIGSAQDYEDLVAALRRHGMGQILDIVPNHMGVGGDDNAWWLDVLENGPASSYAAFFDIDWQPVKDELRGKVLLPILGDHYGRVLEAGGITLRFDAAHGTFAAHYYNHLLPIDPGSYPPLLGHAVERLSGAGEGDAADVMELQSLITAFHNLPGRGERSPERLAERRRDKEVHKRRLAELCARAPRIRRFVEENVTVFNADPSQPQSFDRLHALLEQQAYRPAHWRVAADEINYRRFFDINDLAGLRMDNPEVFTATHRLILRLVREGKAAGLRIDHPDGLYDPLDYYRRLLAAADAGPAGAEVAPADENASPPLYLLAEKILAAYEYLPEDWPVSGTTGYDFANQVNGLFVYAPAERAMTAIYRRFAGRQAEFDELLYERKKLIMRVALSSELNVLAHQLSRLAESDRATRDFTLIALRDALSEIVACFPVYRTYVTPGSVAPEDRRYVEWAIAQAKKRSPAADVSIFDFIRDILLLERFEEHDPDYRQAAGELAQRFQQYTAPVMAKGLEDTCFYIYNRLVSLNDVGGDPRRFGCSVAAFHRANQERARRWPHTMLATSTHDSKRGEDVRARINVLSELSGEWWEHLRLWRRMNRGRKRRIGGLQAPSANDEYLLYQTLIGAWPFGSIDDEGLARLRQRIEDYMLKAVREAKVHTSWINRNEDYEQAVAEFVRGVLQIPDSPFLNDFVTFQARIAWWGTLNALSQTLLKLSAPGVPDLYQGNETWALSLVDPDNRRPVDYGRCAGLLDELESLDRAPRETLPERVRTLFEHGQDGRAKLYVTWRALALRAEKAELFRDGSYAALEADGPLADHLCAFARCLGEAAVVTIAPRWFSRLAPPGTLPLGDTCWSQTRLTGPAALAGRYLNVLTGESLVAEACADGACWMLAPTLKSVPLALLVRQ